MNRFLCRLWGDLAVQPVFNNDSGKNAGRFGPLFSAEIDFIAGDPLPHLAQNRDDIERCASAKRQ